MKTRTAPWDYAKRDTRPAPYNSTCPNCGQPAYYTPSPVSNFYSCPTCGTVEEAAAAWLAIYDEMVGERAAIIDAVREYTADNQRTHPDYECYAADPRTFAQIAADEDAADEEYTRTINQP